jgi:hypothetical protein
MQIDQIRAQNDRGDATDTMVPLSPSNCHSFGYCHTATANVFFFFKKKKVKKKKKKNV